MNQQYPPDPWQETQSPILPPPPPYGSAPLGQRPPAQPFVLARLITAWACIGLCTLILFALQAFGMQMMQKAYAQDTRPGFGAIYIARYAVGIENMFKGQGSQLMPQINGVTAQSPHPVASETRAVIIAGEIDPGSITNRLEYLDDIKWDAQDDERSDAEMIQRIYAQGYTPSPTERDGLIERHGWFGEIAATYNQPSSSAQYKSPRRSASIVVVFLILFVLTLLAAGLAGFVLAIIAIVLLCTGKLCSRIGAGPAGHSSVYLEMVALFLLGFIAIQLVFGVIQELSGIDMMLPILLLSALPLLWPVLLGVGWARYKQDMGFNTGKGLFREIGAGVVGYLTGLPIIAVGIGITFLITLIVSQFTEVQSDHPMQYELLDGGTYTIFLTLAAAVIWAPLVEEAVFRSGFYRHMRQRPGVGSFFLSTGVTAFVFAAIHPQGWVAIPALMSIAFVLSGLREWRGSIIPSMTAHAIHNGAISTLLGVVLFA